MLIQSSPNPSSLMPNPGVNARPVSTPTAPNSGEAGLQGLKHAQVTVPASSLLADTAASSNPNNALRSLAKMGFQVSTPLPPQLSGAIEDVAAQKPSASTSLLQAPVVKVISAPKLHLQPMSREAVVSHLRQINGFEAKPNAGLIERASVWLKGIFKSEGLANINKLLDRYENDQSLVATRKELAINSSMMQGLINAKTLSDLTTVMTQALNSPANSNNPFSAFASQFVLTPANDWQTKLTQILVECNPSLAALVGDTGVAELHASLAVDLPATFAKVDNQEVLMFQSETFQFKERLGAGAFGIALLYKSTNPNSDAQLVVKFPLEDDLGKVAVEYKLHHALSATGPHANLLGLRGLAMHPNGRVCIITDVAKHGALSGVLTQLGKATEITDVDKNFLVKKLMHDLMQGAMRMHETGFVHYDIKPDNVLVHNGTAVLADFGTSRTIAQAVAENTKNTGTHTHMAPEVFDVTYYQASEKSDVWSLGITAYEMLNTVVKKSPAEMALPSSLEGGQSAVLTARRGEAMLDNKARLGNPMHGQENMLETPAIANAQTPLEKLVNRMLAKDPADRPSMAEVLADDVFKVLENTHNEDPDPVQVEAQRLFGAVFNPPATR